MRIAHIIMAHKNPAQLLRLIKRLHHPQFDIYVHLDNKVPIEEFEKIKEQVQVTFIKNRINCNWGGNNFLKGIINSLNEVIALDNNYDFINLLSAQDYPIQSAESMYGFFEKNPEKNYISFEESKESEWWKAAAARYEKYHFTDLNIRWKYLFQNIINKIVPPRKFPSSLELFGSSKSTWWTISGKCAKYVADKLTDDVKLWRFLKYSWGTDEFVISTIIMNSDFKTKTVNDNLRYIDWSEGHSHPKLLGIQDFTQINSSGMMYARKFDLDFDREILDEIDKKCLFL